MNSIEVLRFLNLDREKILEILKEEEKIRFSQEYISKCNAVANMPNGWLEVTSDMQKDLLSKFGYNDLITNTLAVNVIRSANNLFPDDMEIKNSVVHFRENKAKKGNLEIGMTIQNFNLFTINKLKIDINSIIESNKPSVILAGSHTWQPFRGYIQLLEDFYKKNKDRLNIFIIYISEAHANDIWPIGLSAGTINSSHKSIIDRIFCAQKFKREFNLSIPIYCDNMTNDFETAMACWPFRYFVIENSKLKYIGEPEDSTFSIDFLINL